VQYLTLDVGGSGIKYALSDQTCQLRDHAVLPTCYSTHEEFITAIAGIRDQFDDLDGIAISTCGEVDPLTGEMHTGGTLRFNAGTNLIQAVEAACGLPTSVENDANCALVAEMHDGALAGRRNGIVLVLGTAVGGAILIDGEVYRGSSFHSGNVSYTRSSIQHPESRLLADVSGVAVLVGEYLAASNVDDPQLTPRTVFDRVNQGDPHAITALQRYCTPIAAFIHNAQMLLDVEAVCIGGGISAQPLLVDAIREAVTMQFNLAPIPLPQPLVLPCRYRNDANLIGALHHHLRATHADTTPGSPPVRGDAATKGRISA